ncbi:MAG: NFACT RNA binding domain-containing protein [Candidatus Krumholzibacteriia bacterium]
MAPDERQPPAPRPWTEHGRLGGLLAGWRERWAGRPLFAVTAGAEWVRLHLEGADREGILLAAVPGALAIAACRGRLPAPLEAALPPRRDHPLRPLLAGAVLRDLGVLPEDRVAAFALALPDGGTVHLLHRLFGARGDTALVATDGRLLWARHRPPHALLSRVPPGGTWTVGTAAPDDLSAPALDHLAVVLADRDSAALGAALARRLRAAERLTANLTADLAVADQGEELRRRAEALAARLHELRPGQARLETLDPRDGAPLVIDLDPALTPAANLDAAFRAARKADKGRGVIAARLADAQSACDHLAAALAAGEGLPAAPPLDRLAAVQAWRGAVGSLVPAPRPVGSPHAPEEPARPFRRYRIDGRWEVWIGRSNQENDELTHRASHPRDLWLHAQGVPGSHVILRTGGRPEQVPRAVVAKAAALAALHSKARHAGLVPVLWTERRYVRKPRKAPPGLATTLRAQSVFAQPEVAPGVEPA